MVLAGGYARDTDDTVTIHCNTAKAARRRATVEVLLLQAYDKHLEQLTATAGRVCNALRQAGIDYRVVGGLAVFFHVQSRDPLAARLTKDVDLGRESRGPAAHRRSGSTLSDWSTGTLPASTCW